MFLMSGTAYLCWKAFHIIAFTSWFAAMFYLPRLFVYHRENCENKGFVSVVKVMEKKLYKFIALPAFAATVTSGLVMLWDRPEYIDPSVSGGWLHAKLTLVALLIAWFIHNGVMLRQLANDTCTKSGRFFRFYNEIPTIFLLLIVPIVVLKPF
ncbi:MAG: protoporphyrinogen oxidase HemJ [Helicobacteraceae bacterium]|jgi:putative membrane protein|nr:protoporphyrinogen oxidase HemJ [Helicobacteraceae bacterium]